MLTVREGTPLDVALGGEWATAVTCDLTMLVDTAVTEGAEIEATALDSTCRRQPYFWSGGDRRLF